MRDLYEELDDRSDIYKIKVNEHRIASGAIVPELLVHAENTPQRLIQRLRDRQVSTAVYRILEHREQDNTVHAHP